MQILISSRTNSSSYNANSIISTSSRSFQQNIQNMLHTFNTNVGTIFSYFWRCWQRELKQVGKPNWPTYLCSPCPAVMTEPCHCFSLHKSPTIDHCLTSTCWNVNLSPELSSEHLASATARVAWERIFWILQWSIF